MKPIDHYWSNINPVSLLLFPLTIVFCLLSYLRRVLYRLGVLASYRAPLPVLVVGNISVGGTGKTPLIIELVKQLQGRGVRPGVISRGYGGQSDHWPRQVDDATPASLVGDEPRLIYQRTGCPVVVGPDRRADVEMLLSRHECDVVLCDDGMQHYALRRDAEIAVVDARRQFGNGLCLPAGPLREPVSRLSSVDAVLFNGGQADQCAFSLQAMNCLPVGQAESPARALKDFSGQTVHAVAGIGHPARFFSMLESQGIRVIPHAFADHHDYRESDLDFNDELAVLMTEKDAVKCGQFTRANLWSVPVEVSLTETAQQQIDEIIDSLLSKSN